MIAKLIVAAAAAVLCTAGGAFATAYDSDGTYATINIADSMNTHVTRINANGAVTGYYFSTTNDTDLGFIATPKSAAVSIAPTAVVAAPETSTWAMLLAGFAGLALAGYRRTRSKRFALGD